MARGGFDGKQQVQVPLHRIWIEITADWFGSLGMEREREREREFGS